MGRLKTYTWKYLFNDDRYKVHASEKKAQNFRYPTLSWGSFEGYKVRDLMKQNSITSWIIIENSGLAS